MQQAQLREALNQKDDFVAVVSHELRTPANTIAGWARMLADGTIEATGREVRFQPSAAAQIRFAS